MRTELTKRRVSPRTSLRRALLGVAGLCVVVGAGSVATARKSSDEPSRGTELTKRVTFPAPVVLGTRG